MEDLLKNCDYICNVLPSTSKTQGLLSGSVLESCKEKVTELGLQMDACSSTRCPLLCSKLSSSILGGETLQMKIPLSELSSKSSK